MKLDRNGKYALVQLHELEDLDACLKDGVYHFPATAVVFGNTDEFFIIRLKDKNAPAALTAYALAASIDDPEYAGDIVELAAQALRHPRRKRPD